MSEALKRIGEARQKIDQLRRDTLADLLGKCTDGQRNLFSRMYGTTDANEMPDDKIDWAIQQCERTIAKNKAKETT